jgi:ABC-type transporter Mla subunit MlaD
MTDLNELSKEVSKLKTDMAQVNTLVDRLDVTIEKLTEVSTIVSQLLAVQGSRLEQQEKTAAQLSSLLEKRRDEASENYEMLHKRITSSERDFKHEIEKLNDKILDEMKAMREDNAKQQKEMIKKITDLEKWVWLVSGGAAVVGFLMSHVIDLSKFFN